MVFTGSCPSECIAPQNAGAQIKLHRIKRKPTGNFSLYFSYRLYVLASWNCKNMLFCLGVPKLFSVNNFGVANPKCTILHKNTPILLGLDRKWTRGGWFVL